MNSWTRIGFFGEASTSSMLTAPAKGPVLVKSCTPPRENAARAKKRGKRAMADSSSARLVATTVSGTTAPAADTVQLTAEEQLAAWKELLEWFRENFPYNRGACGACGAHGEMLGNVAATPSEAAFLASRTELQLCGACDVVGRFPRYNDVAQILRTRQGRCGEYAQTLYQLVRALGWPARLVVDWTDHLWVETLVDGAAAATEGHFTPSSLRF